MKTIFKIPVLLLALMLFISCGDSKKEKEEEEKLSPVEQAAVDGKKQAEMTCESIKVAREEGRGDSEKMKKIMKDSQDFGDKMYSMYGKEGTASDEAKKAFEEALKVAMEDCMKSVY